MVLAGWQALLLSIILAWEVSNLFLIVLVEVVSLLFSTMLARLVSNFHFYGACQGVVELHALLHSARLGGE